MITIDFDYRPIWLVNNTNPILKIKTQVELNPLRLNPESSAKTNSTPLKTSNDLKLSYWKRCMSIISQNITNKYSRKKAEVLKKFESYGEEITKLLWPSSQMEHTLKFPKQIEFSQFIATNLITNDNSNQLHKKASRVISYIIQHLLNMKFLKTSDKTTNKAIKSVLFVQAVVRPVIEKNDKAELLWLDIVPVLELALWQELRTSCRKNEREDIEETLKVLSVRDSAVCECVGRGLSVYCVRRYGRKVAAAAGKEQDEQKQMGRELLLEVDRVVRRQYCRIMKARADEEKNAVSLIL